MFGSDLPSAIPVELAKYKSLGLSESDLERCLEKTAQGVFRLP
jgi:predicted TIM-barrel fold metal-dependent hydrolase